MIERGACDFVNDIAAELPLQAIAEILGVPQEDRKKLFDWTNAMVGSTDPEYVVSTRPTSRTRRSRCSPTRTSSRSRSAPSRLDDIVTAILNAEVDGERLDELEFDLFFMLLTVAGNETTRNAISHGMLAFFEHPDQWQRLRERPLADVDARSTRSCAGRARSSTSAARSRRTPSCEGQQMKEGDKMTIWYPSANRDEDVFDEPVRRSTSAARPNDHLGFGGRGPHFCLGSNLAKMEIERDLQRARSTACPTSRTPAATTACAPTSSTASSASR